MGTAKLPPTGLFLEGNSLKVRFKDVDTQLKAKTLIQESMGENYVVALNLLPNTPHWLTSLGAHPMFLGLDLRGGVHFLLEIDMKAAVDKAFERIAGDVRRELKDKKIRAGAIKRGTNGVEVQLRDAETLRAARSAIEKALPAVQIADQTSAGNFSLKLTLTETELFRIKTDAVKQNIATLHNRVNERFVVQKLIKRAKLLIAINKQPIIC